MRGLLVQKSSIARVVLPLPPPLDPWQGRGHRQLRWRGRRSDRTHCRFHSIPQGLCSERPRQPLGPSFSQSGLDQTCLQGPNHLQLSPGETWFSGETPCPPGRVARSWVALTSAIQASSASLPALACMPSAISTSPMSSGSSPSTLHVEKTVFGEFVFGVVKYLDPRLVKPGVLLGGGHDHSGW